MSPSLHSDVCCVLQTCVYMYTRPSHISYGSARTRIRIPEYQSLLSRVRAIWRSSSGSVGRGGVLMMRVSNSASRLSCSCSLNRASRYSGVNQGIRATAPMVAIWKRTKNLRPIFLDDATTTRLPAGMGCMIPCVGVIDTLCALVLTDPVSLAPIAHVLCFHTWRLARATRPRSPSIRYMDVS